MKLIRHIRATPPMRYLNRKILSTFTAVIGIVFLAVSFNLSPGFSAQAHGATKIKSTKTTKTRANRRVRVKRHARAKRPVRARKKRASRKNWAKSSKIRKKTRRARKSTKKRRIASKSKRTYRKSRTKRRARKKIVKKPVLNTPHQRLDYAITLAKRGKFDAARAQAKKSGLVLSKKLIEWLIMQHPSSSAKASDIVQFFKINRDWPRRKNLLARAESAFFFQPISPQHTIDYFTTYPPQTGIGKAAMARAYHRKGDDKTAAIWLKHAWIEHDLSKSVERILLSDMGKLLSTKDHLARVAHFTYAGAPRAVMRMKLLLKNPDRRVALAQASLLFVSRRAMARVKAVPKALKNSPPLQYALARYWRKKDKYDKARPHILKAPELKSSMSNPKAWWKERHTTARYLLAKGKIEQAYNLVKSHGMKSGHNFAQAEFFAGWLALVHLKKPELALGHFTVLRNGVKKPRSIARAEYWCGRAHRELKQLELAKNHFENAAKYPKTFYGQLARDELGKSSLVTFIVEPPAPGPVTKAVFDARELVEVTRMLAKAERMGLVHLFLSALMTQATSQDEAAAVAGLAHEFNLPHVGIRIAKQAEAKGIDMGSIAYPHGILPNYRHLKSVDDALLYGLIRQESEFNAQAKSWAGARGLMQIMPKTARLIARQYKQRYRRDKLTKDPAYNLKLGSAHLQDLINNHRGSYIMALTSYNAGPGRTLKWASAFGDPRGKLIDPIDWIESIPFNETRDYVQKVMENVRVYRSSLTPGQGMSLTRELNRGTPPESNTKKKTKKKTKKVIKPKAKPPKQKT